MQCHFDFERNYKLFVYDKTKLVDCIYINTDRQYCTNFKHRKIVRKYMPIRAKTQSAQKLKICKNLPLFIARFPNLSTRVI